MKLNKVLPISPFPGLELDYIDVTATIETVVVGEHGIECWLDDHDGGDSFMYKEIGWTE